jgi:hypothetical protein
VALARNSHSTRSARFGWSVEPRRRQAPATPAAASATMIARDDLRAKAQLLKAAVSIAGVIGETLPLKRTGRILTAVCPFHGERTPSFTIYSDHFHCYGCGAHGDVIDWLRRARGMSFADAIAYLTGGGSSIVCHAQPAERWNRPGHPRMQEIARVIWSDAIDPHSTLAEAYLHSRGLELPDEPVLRFHPRCPCDKDRLPAMVALMSDPLTGDPRGIHRTFLLPDGSGKADIPEPKMMLGDAGVVRLYEPETAGLGLAEGIETALAVAQCVGWGPVWAAGTAGAIGRFPLLRYHRSTSSAITTPPA